MDFSDFTGDVQHRLELATQVEAVRATRAVRATIGERVQEGEPTALASPLPREIDYYVVAVDHGQRLDDEEYVNRVADRAEVAGADAAFYGQAVVALLADTVPGGEVADLRPSLPDDYAELFELVDAESTPWPEL